MCTLSFELGDAFTIVSFNGPTRFAVTSEFVEEHAIWYITYVSADHQSHYTQTMCVQRDLSIWRSTSCAIQSPSLRHGITSGEYGDPFVSGTVMYASSIVVLFAGLPSVLSGKLGRRCCSAQAGLLGGERWIPERMVSCGGADASVGF